MSVVSIADRAAHLATTLADDLAEQIERGLTIVETIADIVGGRVNGVTTDFNGPEPTMVVRTDAGCFRVTVAVTPE